MEKISLIKILSSRFNINEIEIADFVDLVFGEMKKAFKQNKNIHIPDFGKFIVHHRNTNGEKNKYISFSPAVKFSNSVNKNFEGLKPLVITAFNLKESEKYFITEIPEGYLINDVTFFGFEDSEILSGLDKKTEYTSKPKPDSGEYSGNDNEITAILKTEDTPVFEIDDSLSDVYIPENTTDSDVIDFQKIKPQNVFVSDIFAEEPPAAEKQNETPEIVNENTNSPKDKLPESKPFTPLSDLKLLGDYNITKLDDELTALLGVVKHLIHDIDNDNITKDDTKKAQETLPVDNTGIESTIFETLPEKSEDTLNSEKPFEILSPSDNDIIKDFEERFKDITDYKNKTKNDAEGLSQEIKSNELNVFNKLISETENALIEETPAETKKAEIPYETVSESHNIFEEHPLDIPGESKNDIEIKAERDKINNINEDIIETIPQESKDDNKVKSYDDVFARIETTTQPSSKQTDEKFKHKMNYVAKFFVYFFFVLIMGAVFFYVYKSVLLKNPPNILDTLGTRHIDSVKKIIPADSIETKDSNFVTTEDIVIEQDGDVYYRQTSEGYKVQIASYDKLSNAEKFLTQLKEKNIEAKIEREDMPMSKVEYRIILGPFKTLKEAKNFYTNSYMIFNYIKILVPAKSNFLVL